MNSKNVPEHLESYATEISNRTGLSPTRSKVIVLIKLQKEKSEIASILDITERTVQNHIQDIRKEVDCAEELLDVFGPSHYNNNMLYKEFGGALWIFCSGMKYEKNEDTMIEKKLYSSPYDSVLLVERERRSSTGSITEERKRTEFYSGSDVPHHLLREGKFNSYPIAALHVAFIANAGIDPKYAPSELLSDAVESPNIPNEQQYIENLFEQQDEWIELE